MQCVHADLLEWEPIRRYGLWHDRALFHFLVDDARRQRYVDVLGRTLAPKGAVIVGTFAADGPESCSGLPVRRYSATDLEEALGDRFIALETRREEHITPRAAVQPFTWIAGRLD